MVRPHVAVITTVGAGAPRALPLGRGDRRGQGRDLQGLMPGGTAVLPRDNPHFALLERRAPLGRREDRHASASTRTPMCALLEVDLGPKGSVGHRRHARRSASPIGRRARRALRAELARRAGGAAARSAPISMRRLPALARASQPPAGRGARTLLDGPTRPHPADRRELQRQSGLDAGGAVAAMAARRASAFPRRIAVLGDMLELGAAGREAARGLAGSG